MVAVKPERQKKHIAVNLGDGLFGGIGNAKASRRRRIHWSDGIFGSGGMALGEMSGGGRFIAEDMSQFVRRCTGGS